ncbi:MAG: DUF2189 domain-containing protein [Rhizobiaceae bacterium]|nr:DUF2189 domain-containing protein [Rhizobiaceae bacterium]
MAEHSAQGSPAALPPVVALSAADIRTALTQGMADFARAPAYGLAFGAVFAAIGMVIVLSLTRWHVPWMIYPFAIGFPLVGPFAAIGLYEVSRRLQADLPVGWSDLVRAIWRQRRREPSWMAFVMLFIFWIWMYQVRLLIALMLGRMSFATFDRFVSIVLTTPQGWLFLAVGHVIGGVLALVLYSLTVVSIPLLMDRDYDVLTGMLTSLRVVVASPLVMLGWGVVVTLCVIVACVPFFLGLLVVLPVLGHTTWHIYRKAVPGPSQT